MADAAEALRKFEAEREQAIRDEVVRQTGVPERYVDLPPMPSMDERVNERVDRAKAAAERIMNRGVTTDRSDPRLARGSDDEPREQAEVYLVLSAEERAKGYVRPFRKTYVHLTCGMPTTMGDDIAATYAAKPTFYSGTYCAHCRMHKPVGADGEFVWQGSDEKVGT